MSSRTWSALVSRWSVATLGALLVVGGAVHVSRDPGSPIPFVEVGLVLVVGLVLLFGGGWLGATRPADHVARLAVWSLVGILVGCASLVWFAFVLSLEEGLVGDPVVLTLNAVAISVAVFTLLGRFASNLRHRERELEESRTRFRALTENSSFAVITADEAGTIRYANDAVEELFGYESPELVGESVDVLFRESPADADRHPGEGPDPSGAHPLERSRGVLTAQPADGAPFPARVSFGEYVDGDTHLFTGIVQDISERRAVEERLQDHSTKVTRLHDIATGITRADTEETIYSRAVEGAVELFDCDGASLFLAENDHLSLEESAGLASLEPDGTRPGTPVDLADSYRSGGVVRIDDLQETRSTSTIGADDSEDRPIAPPDSGADQHGDDVVARATMIVPLDEVGVLQVFDAEPGAFTPGDEEVAELLATHVVTARDRVVAEASIRRERDRLEEFANVLSHDIRNPLTVAEGRLHLAREVDDPEEHLAAIERAHERIHRLIEDVLALAVQGDQVGATEPVDLETAARVAWDTVATDDATLRIEGGGEVEADRTRLLQLFENLYRNAITHGGADVTVTVGTVDGGFYVEDTGPGVPEADRDAVFESGYSTAPDGTGFGLSIVVRIAEAHGWAIELTEGADGGARFEVTGLDVRDG